MKLHELKAEVADLVGIPDDLPCDQTANALEYLLSDLRRAPREAWEQVDQLNDQINELKQRVALDSHHRKMAERKAEEYQETLRNIEARFEIAKEILEGVDFPL